MLQESAKYEEWLTTIANTRLVYNTIDELEDMLDNHSIHSNGIKRCFSSQQKMCAAFRNLKVEVSLMTDESVKLDVFLENYKKTWQFYRANLLRRAAPEKTALEILNYCFHSSCRDVLTKKKETIYSQIDSLDISIPILIMLLMKSLPGYDSKDGDVVNMNQSFESVMSLLEKFTYGATIFELLPVITKARNAECKTRILLYHYVQEILATYRSYNDTSFYETSSGIKNILVDMDIEGFWNECSGTLEYTRFWQIEKALNVGSYFATLWRKTADNKLIGIRYGWFLSEWSDGTLVIYVLHPEAIKHRIKGLPYSDNDNTWYKTAMPDEDCPVCLPLQRIIPSKVWSSSLSLTKVTDEKVLRTYENWMKSLDREMEFSDSNYTFVPDLYAITEDFIYIPTENEGEYFRIPKDCHDGLDKIKFGDNVGVMQMNGKTYLAFDEFMLYISTSNKELEKYKIERVDYIE